MLKKLYQLLKNRQIKSIDLQNHKLDVNNSFFLVRFNIFIVLSFTLSIIFQIWTHSKDYSYSTIALQYAMVILFITHITYTKLRKWKYAFYSSIIINYIFPFIIQIDCSNILNVVIFTCLYPNILKIMLKGYLMLIPLLIHNIYTIWRMKCQISTMFIQNCIKANYNNKSMFEDYSKGFLIFGIMIWIITFFYTNKIEYIKAKLKNARNNIQELTKKLENSEKATEEEVKLRSLITNKYNEKCQELDNIIKNNEKFLSNLADNIKNPLDTLIMNIEYLIEEFKTSKNTNFLLGNVKNSAENILQSMNNMIDQAKFPLNKIEIAQIPVNIFNVLHKAWISKAALMKRKKINAQLYISKDLEKYYLTDPNRLEDILAHILSNSIRMAENGTLKLIINWFAYDINKDIPNGLTTIISDKNNNNIMNIDKLSSMLEDESNKEILKPHPMFCKEPSTYTEKNYQLSSDRGDVKHIPNLINNYDNNTGTIKVRGNGFQTRRNNGNNSSNRPSLSKSKSNQNSKFIDFLKEEKYELNKFNGQSYDNGNSPPLIKDEINEVINPMYITEEYKFLKDMFSENFHIFINHTNANIKGQLNKYYKQKLRKASKELQIYKQKQQQQSLIKDIPSTLFDSNIGLLKFEIIISKQEVILEKMDNQQIKKELDHKYYFKNKNDCICQNQFNLGMCTISEILKKLHGTSQIIYHKDFGYDYIILIPIQNIQKTNMDYQFSPLSTPSPSSLINNAQRNNGINMNQRAIIIDEDPKNRIVLQSYLEKLGVESTCCCDGLEAYKTFINKGIGYFSFIIMDMQMTEMNGIKTYQKIRKYEKEKKVKRNIPIIITTSTTIPTSISCGLCITTADDDRIKFEEKLKGSDNLIVGGSSSSCGGSSGDISLQATLFYKKPITFDSCKSFISFVKNQEQNLQHLNVLIVDHDDLNILVIGQYFQLNGIKYDKASNFKQAKEKLANESCCYNAIIINCEWPDVKAQQVIQKLRSYIPIIKEKDIVIIGISSQKNIEISEFDMILLGMHEIFYKPFDFKRIVNYLKHVIQKISNLIDKYCLKRVIKALK